MKLHLATPDDVPAMRELIPRSVRALSQAHYSARQIESAIRYVFGPDTQLIRDGTYFVVTDNGGALAGCGGWSRRQTLYGGDQAKAADLDKLLPLDEPARVRAFFVDPLWARHGVATRLLTACEEAAAAAGYRRLTLVATLPGVAFYRRHGFTEDEPVETTLPDGTAIAFVRMTRHVGAPPADPPSRFS